MTTIHANRYDPYFLDMMDEAFRCTEWEEMCEWLILACDQGQVHWKVINLISL